MSAMTNVVPMPGVALPRATRKKYTRLTAEAEDALTAELNSFSDPGNS